MIVGAQSPYRALQYIDMAHEFFEKEGENACVNIKQYVSALKQMDIDLN